jgi:hypothetical protein
MTAVAYLVVYAVALTPGLPLGFALFGRRHAAGWVAGALLGYVLTSVALWIPIAAGHAKAIFFIVSWLAVFAICFRRTRAPIVPLPPWRRRDSLSLIAVFAIVLAIAIPPFAKAGAVDSEGNRYYRAYFTADFVWHEALTAEMAKFASPPRNPYLAARPVHYYWTYFLLPSTFAGLRPAPDAIDTSLKINAVGTALLFVSAIFMAAWAAVPRAGPVAVAVTLAIVASSAEGWYAILRFWSRGAPLDGLRNLNIDALTNWWLGGLRVDGLQRCFWWVPQHSMAYALGLVALTIVTAAGSAAPLGAIVVAGIALAGSVAMNPFVGAVFSLTYGVAVLVDVARSRFSFHRVVSHTAAAVPVVLALLWCVMSQMVEGAGGALQIGWLGDARHAPVATLLLSLGPACLPAFVGAAIKPKPDISRANAVVPAIVLALVSLVLLYFVRLRVDASWVGFRAGQMVLVAVPPLLARGLMATQPARRLFSVILVLAAFAGLPTTLIDAYNAQDISNVSQSPNGPWTIVVTRQEREGLDWLRVMTPSTSIAQMDPIARQRQTWSLIPSVAERRMAAGLPISLLDIPEYHEKSDRVKAMYETPDARQAWSLAHTLRIDYVYIDRVERSAYPGGMAKFDRAEYFTPVFRNDEVTIYRVQ